MHPRKARKGGQWRIAELATLAGTTPRAIRLYHKEGLLPEAERTDRGYRRYGSADLASLMGFRRLRSLGFSVDQIRQLLSSGESATSRPPLKHSKLTSASRSSSCRRRPG